MTAIGIPVPLTTRWFTPPAKPSNQKAREARPDVAAGRPLVLATDIDGTLTGGPSYHRLRLNRELEERPHTFLVYVTDHSATWVARKRQRSDIPRADVTITDGGARVRTRRKKGPLLPLQTEINARWPGPGLVRSRLVPLDTFLKEVPRPELPPMALRYTVRAGLVTGEVVHAVRQTLHDLDVEVELSGQQEIVITPKLDKARVLLRALEWLDVEEKWVLLGGNLLESPALQRSGLRGFVLADASPELKDVVARRDDLYCARSTGPKGVWEALNYFGFTRWRSEHLTIVH